uniref:Uncharacterized protein n=1 Tax=Cajanus cajan TaxID=3821 RepID=A0A151RK83_CAJCA|nr:hypothetical protein KK1_035598 [Cajanus cajan]
MAIKSTLRCFGVVAGLKVNFHKSILTGRVCLINSILTSLSLFYLSFYKMSSHGWLTINLNSKKILMGL